MTAGGTRRSPMSHDGPTRLSAFWVCAALGACGGSSAAQPDVDLAPVAAVPDLFVLPEAARRLSDALADSPGVAAEVYGRFWTFEEPPLSRWRTRFGFEPSTAWLDRTRRAALRLGEFCSAAFVSPDGLIATSSDCARVCVEEVEASGSTPGRSGFLATRRDEEPRCRALYADQLVAAVDVSERLLGARETRDLRGVERRDALELLSRELEEVCGAEPGRVCRVAELFEGRRYVLYQFDRYRDVRLVYFPDAAAENPGARPATFDGPRSQMRIALLRARAPDGRPALETPHYLEPDGGGPRAGETVLVAGHPGPTSRGMTLSQYVFERSVRHPLLAAWSGQRLRILESAPDASLTPMLRAGRTGLASSTRLFDAQLASLTSHEVTALKLHSDKVLRERLAADPDLTKYAATFEEMTALQVEKAQVFPELLLSDPAGPTAGPHLRLAADIVARAAQMNLPESDRSPPFRGEAARRGRALIAEPGTLDAELSTALLAGRIELARTWLPPDHPLRRLGNPGASATVVAERIVEASRLGDYAFRLAVLDLTQAQIAELEDPLLELAGALADRRARALGYWNAAASRESRLASSISMVRGRVFGDSAAPDGTRTLRISEGRVAAAGAGDSASRAITETMFFATNDAAAGTGGSPVISTDGRILGVLVDGNSAAAAGEFVYGAPGARTIAVRFDALLDVLRDVPKSAALLAELGAGP